MISVRNASECLTLNELMLRTSDRIIYSLIHDTMGRARRAESVGIFLPSGGGFTCSHRGSAAGQRLCDSVGMRSCKNRSSVRRRISKRSEVTHARPPNKLVTLYRSRCFACGRRQLAALYCQPSGDCVTAAAAGVNNARENAGRACESRATKTRQ